jgi:hypothetical protein
MYRVNVPRFVLEKYNPIHKTENYKRAIHDTVKRLKDRYNIDLNSKIIIEKLNENENVTYGYLYEVIMEELYIKNSVKHWAEKNQLLWRQIPWFINNISNPKVLLIIRDPRSVLTSFKKYTYAEKPAYLQAVFNCFDSMKSALKYQNEYSGDVLKIVKYEEAALNPNKTARDIWDMFDVNYSDDIDVTDQSLWEDSYGEKWHANSSFHDNCNPSEFDVNMSINRWKNNLEKAEIDFTEAVCGSLMSQFGYELKSNEVDFKNVLRLFISSAKELNILKNWVLNDEGIQEFPTDPVDSKNWEENVLSYE